MENIRYKVHLTENYQNKAIDKLISNLKTQLSANEEYIKELEDKIEKLTIENINYKKLHEADKLRLKEYKKKYKEHTSELKCHPEYQKLVERVEILKKIRDTLINSFYAGNNK